MVLMVVVVVVVVVRARVVRWCLLVCLFGVCWMELQV